MDISQSVWNEVDDNNNSAAPDGAPEGMAPSGVNNLIRADRGAIKRWYNQTIPLVTGGSSTAYTLSYSVAPTTLADGMTHLLRFHTTNGAAATLNVNALGAKPLFAYIAGTWMAAPAGAFPADFIARVAFDNASGNYRILGMSNCLGVKTFSGVANVDFDNVIPATANNIWGYFSIIPDNGAIVEMETSRSAGVFDSGSTDYYWNFTLFNTLNGTPTVGGSTGSIIALTNAVDTTLTPAIAISGDFSAANIQGATRKQINFRCNFASGGNGAGTVGYGVRNNVSSIVGLRFMSNGTGISGKISLFASI